MIAEGIYKIKGNIGAGPSNEKFLNVINPSDGEPIVAGDNNNFRTFLIKNHEPGTISFKEQSSGLFIGFDANTKTLMLVSGLVKWNSILRTNAFEVNRILEPRVFCWEMNNIVINSTIILGMDLSEPSPPKQKWIFVWVQSAD